MNRLNATVMTAGLLGFALATPAVAQQTQEQFPRERTTIASCENVDWNANMLRNHPRLIDACQEVVLVEGEAWARFAAQFVRVERDGHVVFNVLDQRDRAVEKVQFMPAAGQVAYISDRPTPFRQLQTTDSISLYVPEGQYGFATQPGAPREELATVIAPAPAPVTERTVAQRTTQPAVLPATASSLPWLPLAGFLSLLAGMVLTMRRWI